MASKRRYLKMEIYSRMDLSALEALALREMKLSSKEYGALWRKTEFRSENAEEVLKFISEYHNGFFRPDRCDLYEPIREIFNPQDLSAPIRWLSQPRGCVMLKKIKPFKYEGFVENMRFSLLWEGEGKEQVPMERPPDPVFLTEWCLWIDSAILKKTSADFVTRFFIDLYLASQGDYGFLTMKEDHENKNHLVTYDKHGSSSKFVGDNLEKCLPGVYWANIFGKLFVDWFGEDKFLSLPCFHKEKLVDGSFFVLSAEDPFYFEKLETKTFVKEIINHLGSDAFFDIHNLDKVCKTPRFDRLKV